MGEPDCPMRISKKLNNKISQPFLLTIRKQQERCLTFQSSRTIFWLFLCVSFQIVVYFFFSAPLSFSLSHWSSSTTKRIRQSPLLILSVLTLLPYLQLSSLFKIISIFSPYNLMFPFARAGIIFRHLASEEELQIRSIMCVLMFCPLLNSFVT